MRWLIGTAPLGALLSTAPALARKFFDRPEGFTPGGAPGGLAATPVGVFQSFAAWQAAGPGPEWVLYSPEAWPGTTPPPTPLVEQQHPTALMTVFAQAARAAGQRSILAPARNLCLIDGCDCPKQEGENLDQAYLRCGLPAAGAAGDVFSVQSQADQGDPGAFAALVAGAIAQLPAGHEVWAGLTTLRGDPVPAITACYRRAVDAGVSGFWLNSSAATVAAAAAFLKTAEP